MKDEDGRLPIHYAFQEKLDSASFQLILDAAVEHGVIKDMLEAKKKDGGTCLNTACYRNLHIDSFRLLLEYLSKYADIKTILKQQDDCGYTILHDGCTKNLAPDSMRLVISFYPSKEMFQNVLVARNNAVDYVTYDALKKVLQDSDCWQKSRLWLLRNHEKTFLFSLFPHSFDRTCQALKELTKNGLQHSQQHATIMLIALMSTPSKFREALTATNYTAPMASSFHDVIKKKGDKKKSDYNCWRNSINLFREFYGQWPPSERKTATTYEGEGSSSCVIQ